MLQLACSSWYKNTSLIFYVWFIQDNIIFYVFLQCRLRLCWIVHVNSCRETLLWSEILNRCHIQAEVNNNKTQEVRTFSRTRTES